jgi:hypothetical protein
MKMPASGEERGGAATGAESAAAAVMRALLLVAAASADGVSRGLEALGERAPARLVPAGGGGGGGGGVAMAGSPECVAEARVGARISTRLIPCEQREENWIEPLECCVCIPHVYIGYRVTSW